MSAEPSTLELLDGRAELRQKIKDRDARIAEYLAENAQLQALVDSAYTALRGIDAADQTRVIPERQLDVVSDAVLDIDLYRAGRISVDERPPIEGPIATVRTPSFDEVAQAVRDAGLAK